MKIPSKHIENAVDQIASLPGIGRKTALRLVLNLLNRSQEEVHDFSEAFLTMKSNVKKCISETLRFIKILFENIQRVFLFFRCPNVSINKLNWFGTVWTRPKNPKSLK